MTKLRSARRGYHEVLMPAPHSRYVRGLSRSRVFTISSNSSGYIIGQFWLPLKDRNFSSLVNLAASAAGAQAGSSCAARSSNSLAVSPCRIWKR